MRPPSPNPPALLALVIVWIGLGGCRTRTGPRASESAHAHAAPARITLTGMTNTFRLTSGVWSGSQPDGDAAFAALAAAGVRTVVSVDGTRPDVGAARRHGLRYVHVPIGYDGIPAGAAGRLARIPAEVPGPVFVHCHHGQHRGPAAAALIARVGNGWTPDEARRWLVQAGTSTHYPGLYASVQSATPVPVPDISRSPLPEVAEIPDRVAHMVVIDGLWDRVRGATPGGDDPETALLLWEAFRELDRTLPPTGRAPDRYREALDASIRHAGELHAARSGGGAPDSAVAARRALEALRQDCRACHRDCRD